MATNQHDERRQLCLLTQQEVCDLAGCSRGRFQYHLRRGLIPAPAARLHSRYYYSETQAAGIAQYMGSRKPWERNNTMETKPR